MKVYRIDFPNKKDEGITRQPRLEEQQAQVPAATFVPYLQLLCSPISILPRPSLLLLLNI